MPHDLDLSKKFTVKGDHYHYEVTPEDSGVFRILRRKVNLADRTLFSGGQKLFLHEHKLCELKGLWKKRYVEVENTSFNYHYLVHCLWWCGILTVERKIEERLKPEQPPWDRIEQEGWEYKEPATEQPNEAKPPTSGHRSPYYGFHDDDDE